MLTPPSGLLSQSAELLGPFSAVPEGRLLAMMPMTPVLPSGSAPLESAPSLEILQSEDEAHEVAKEAEALEPSTRDLLQVWAIHYTHI